MIKRYLEKRRAEQRKEEMQFGYEYAAGMLLRERGCPDHIAYLTIHSYGSIADTPFDMGVRDALRDWSTYHQTPNGGF